MNKTHPVDPFERYQGFSLQDVTWGYRVIFEEAIERLFQEKHIGLHRPETTQAFFRFLNHCSNPGLDHVIHAFLKALTPQTKWIIGLPGIFQALLDTGTRLTQYKISAGLRFFQLVGNSGLGTAPADVQYGLHQMQILFETDPDLPLAFLQGYPNLCARMTPPEIDRYLDAALTIHKSRKENGYAFLRGELNTSETYILSITKECLLQDVSNSLKALIQALCNRDVEINHLGFLDSDDLIMHGSQVVQMGDHLYLPERVRTFDSQRKNNAVYTLCAIVAAAMWQEKSFPDLHGRPGIRNASFLCGADLPQQNLFLVFEITRVLRRIYRRWPGARSLLRHALQANLTQRPEQAPEQLILKLVDHIPAPFRKLINQLDRCTTCFATADLLEKTQLPPISNLDTYRIPPFDFLPDFFFPGEITDPPFSQWIADHNASSKKDSGDSSDDAAPDDTAPPDEAGDLTEETPGQTVITFVYDEWDFQQNDYRPDWCHIHQTLPDTPHSPQPVPAEWKPLANRVRRIFERLKPDLVHREKYLADGDTMNTNRLVEYMVDRRHTPDPPIHFYEKPLIQHRDPSVLILLDLSGSTASEIAEKVKIIDLEKQAGVILGEGLNTLDDRFAVCGFNSFGREQCHYMVFKDFEDNWSPGIITRLMNSYSQNSTRIGPAIRHSTHLITNQPTRQKLILLITDGKPMDNGYDPATRYAQHDVRMACEEARRSGIHTFAISTEENSVEDMELMFPKHRYVLLPNISRLPAVLPRLYMQLTK